jgi:deazaflavin-dependent oxidoreductase (nitroreductase family)
MNSPLSAFRAPSAGSASSTGSLDFWSVSVWVFPTTIFFQVRGRKSGKIYSTPIDLLELGGKRFLVAPRGYTQWVRNAEAAGEVTLPKGSKREKFGLRALSDQEKPAILKAYLDQFRREVQRYFPVAAGSPMEAFGELVQSYPAFELVAR